jgi:hypothetical protein
LQIGTSATPTGAVTIDAGGDITLNGTAAALLVVTATGTRSLAYNLTTIGTGGALQVLNGASLSGGTITDNGLLAVSAASFTPTSLIVSSTGMVNGTGMIAGSITDNGLVEAAGGTLTTSGAVTGSGTIAIDVNSMLNTGSSVSAGISFLSTGGVLEIGGTLSGFTAAIAGFGYTDTVDLLYGSVSSAIASLSLTGTTLTLDGSGGGSLGTLTFTGDAGQSFGFASDGHGGTNLFLI